MDRESDPNGPEGYSTPALKVAFLLLDQFTLTAFSGFIDALRLAADIGGRSRQLACAWSILGREPVTASCGLRVDPDSASLPEDIDYLAVCGGNGYRETSMPRWLEDLLAEADARHIRLIGVCTGTFALARAGLLTGRIACVHWNVHDAFRQQFPGQPVVCDRIFFESGRYITCAGSTGSIDLALHLISRHCGPEKAQQAQRHMFRDEMRPANSPQPHFYTDLDSVTDERVRRAARFMEQTLNAPVSLTMVAGHINTSLRQLERCFKQAVGVSPETYYRSMRLRYAGFLLRHTDLRVSDIAIDCGFCDASHFGRSFTQEFGCNPRTFRKARLDQDPSQLLATSEISSAS